MTKRHRIATRALILDPEDNFLLFLSHFDPGSNLDPRWVFPGGGLENGELPIQGILREIREETGLQLGQEQVLDLNLVIHHEMEDNRVHDTGEAHFFIHRVPSQFEPSKEYWTESEHRDTVTHRWWSIQEVLDESPWIGPDGAIEFLLAWFQIKPQQPHSANQP